jgi:hypothetical protein
VIHKEKEEVHTSASLLPNCQPIKRLKAETVFWEFTTAWHSAGRPTRRLPLLGERDDEWCCPCTFQVLNDMGSLALHDEDARSFSSQYRQPGLEDCEYYLQGKMTRGHT